MSASFELTTEAGVAHLRLCRPDERNTLLPEIWSELPAAVESLDADGSTRALVVSSTGTHFSAGLDLSVLSGGMFGTPPEGTETGRRRANVYEGIQALHDSFTSLERARFPVIAAVQGGCVGGAVALVAACDLRYAARDAFFLLQEVNLGIVPDVGQLQRLPKLMPEGLVSEMALRGTRLPAGRAHEVGLVNELFDDHDALVAGALAVAVELAAKSPLVLWGAKRTVAFARDHSVAEGLEQVALWQAAMYHRTEAAEAVNARQENRPPAYQDLLPLTLPGAGEFL